MSENTFDIYIETLLSALVLIVFLRRTLSYNCEILSDISEMVSISCVHTSVSNSLHQQSLNSSSCNCSSISPTIALDSSLSKHEHPVALN